jgi:manganese/zinc/iron transport system permease protein
MTGSANPAPTRRPCFMTGGSTPTPTHRACVTVPKVALSLALLAMFVNRSYAAEPKAKMSLADGNITDNSVVWPSRETLVRAFALRDYNTRVVVIGTTLLGLAAGAIGTFAYLRRRALLGDALSHATLPGVALAFLIVQKKNLPALLVGAAATGVLGVLAVAGLRRIPRIKEDAAIGTVLSVFFGIGLVLMSVVQSMTTGEQAGLSSFIFGKAAALGARDATLIGACAAVVIVGSALLYKEFRLICFDEAFAASQGWSVFVVDLLMMGLVVLTTVVGLQAVGLILVVALLIIPAAAARFWTDRLSVMVLIAGAFGAISGWLGATISALLPRLPTGAIIVLCAGAIFIVGMFLSPHRGVLAAVMRHRSLARRTGFQHLLRALVEFEERDGVGCSISIGELLSVRSWSPRQLHRLTARALRRGLVERRDPSAVRLTGLGRVEARRVLRNHRLWEAYLIKYADIAPSHVDRDADEIEHILPEPLIRELEAALEEVPEIPPSPHALEPSA